MKAAVLYQPGDAHNLTVETRKIPKPTGDSILIKIKAFGLNRSELMTRKGYSPNVKFPRILGIECAGEVEHDPANELSKGQKVIAFMGEMGRSYDGSYAEYTLLPRSIVYPIESSLPWEILGAIPEMYQTVHGSLFTALDIHKNETLLIRGGTSSVGLLAAQVAKREGLTVVSTTRNHKKEQLLLENGASYVLIDDETIQYKVNRLFPGGVDKVLELVGTNTLKDSIKCVKPGGTICMSGMLSEQWSISAFSPMEFIPATVKLTIYDSGQIRSNVAVFQNFIEAVEAGEISLKIGKVFNLDDIVEAHVLMERNKADGKIIILT